MPPTRRSVPRSDSWLSLMRGDRVLQILEDAVAQLQQRFAGRRDADAPADAMEDRLAELVFEQQDLPADGRLRDVQLLARRRERAGFGDGADDFELPQIHWSEAYITRYAWTQPNRMTNIAVRALRQSDAPCRDPCDRLLQIALVHLDADEVQPELRARDGGRPESEEGIGDAS